MLVVFTRLSCLEGNLLQPGYGSACKLKLCRPRKVRKDEKKKGDKDVLR